MKLVALLVLVPSLAFADKSWSGDHQTILWDCKTDPVASIMGNQSSFILSGPCKNITVLGNQNRVHVDTADSVSVTGNNNNVIGDHVTNVAVAGHDNTVTAKGATASNVGDRNTVTTK
jgi:Protein of unknown function (DUF3060)